MSGFPIHQLAIFSFLFIGAAIADGGRKLDENLNAMQKHVLFFDKNKDGVIDMSETYDGLRAIGLGAIAARAGSVFINTALSAKTRPGEGFDAKFPIVIKNIQLSKHGSDSDVFDEQGRFVEAKFDEIFQKHAHTNPNALTSDELSEMLKANRDPKDFKGWAAAAAEWKMLYTLGKDDKGLLQKETLMAAYDGTLFHQLANKNQSKN